MDLWAEGREASKVLPGCVEWLLGKSAASARRPQESGAWRCWEGRGSTQPRPHEWLLVSLGRGPPSFLISFLPFSSFPSPRG